MTQTGQSGEGPPPFPPSLVASSVLFDQVFRRLFMEWAGLENSPKVKAYPSLCSDLSVLFVRFFFPSSAKLIRPARRQEG